MELEQETNQDAENFEQDENEILGDLEDLKNNEIQTLPIAPFAVPIYPWNDLKDSVNWAETLIGMNTALKNHMVKYNRLIDTVAQLTRDWNSDISQLQVSLAGTHSIAKDANTKVVNAISRIENLDAWRVDQTALNTNLKNWRDTSTAEISALWNSNTARKNETTNNLNEIKLLWSSNDLRKLEIATLNTNVTQLFANTTALSKSNDLRMAETAALSKSNDLRMAETAALSKSNDLRMAETAALSKSNDLRKSEINSLDSRIKKIEAFDFGSVIDLTVLVTAINSVGTKVQKLVDLFNVTKIEPGSFTFFLQASIKTQTDAIIQALAMVDESLNDNFINYFSDWKNGQFWKAFKEFDDFQMAVFFGVFFDNYRLELEKTWVNTLEVWNTTNGYLSSSYNALVIITQWLKQIYEKPSVPGIVNVPPFDYVRLEKMLKKLEFGEITNEAGTNIWDFLSSIVDNLGDIITTQLKEFVKVLREILDFLDKLIDKLIGLLVPENVDFMRTGFDDISLKFNLKFDSFLSIATDVTNMFKPIPKSVIDELSFDLMGVPFVPKLSLLDSFVPKFRNVMALMLWFQTGWWAFRRFTGTGDVVNDS